MHISLPDGRRLGYQVLGDPDGFPVVLVHGTPGSSRQVAGLGGRAKARGLTLIAPDRAGYGRSTHDPGRTFASGARDLGELIAGLGRGPCAVVGLSGGGPTALACGAILADQVCAVATVGGVGPLLPRDPSLPPDRLVIRLARHSEPATALLFSLLARSGRKRPEKTTARLAKVMAEPDADLLRDDPQVRDAFIDDLSHSSPTTGRAAARDFRLFELAWDFELKDIKVPVHVWHGTADRNVPVAHARVITSRCPAAELHIVEGGGHLLLAQFDQIIASILASGKD